MTSEAMTRALRRADVWHLLARIFQCPDAAALVSQAAVAGDLLNASTINDHPLRDSLGDFARAASETDAALLEQEYHQLFTTQMLCPPNEGAYHRASRGAVLGDIAAFYEAFGLRVRATGGAPDSIPHELYFLAWLALKEANAIHHQRPADVEVTRNAARTFLTDHLGRWAAAFVDRLVTATPTPYYTAAARLLMNALESFTREFAVRDVEPLSAKTPAEADSISCPAASLCAPSNE